MMRFRIRDNGTPLRFIRNLWSKRDGNGDIAHSAATKQHRLLESAANLHCGECESARSMINRDKFAESEIIRDDKCPPARWIIHITARDYMTQSILQIESRRCECRNNKVASCELMNWNGKERGKRDGSALDKNKTRQFPSSCIAERDLRGYIEIGRYSILYIALDST